MSLDLLRVLAAQAIVIHHLAFYGPLSDVARPFAPGLLAFFARHGRLAVQVFFVLGGFLAARSLAKVDAFDLRTFRSFVSHRYRRLAFPYFVALAMAVAANGIASQWMVHRSISPAPTFGELLAHGFFLQDILGIPALTAGIWYLAIDLQLVLLTGLAALTSTWLVRACRPWRRMESLGLLPLVSGSLAVASLFWFNRVAALDVWAIYFFGSYYLGLALYWALSGRLHVLTYAGYLTLVIAALAVEWRLRPVVALATALAILTLSRLRSLERWPGSRFVSYLARTSYSLFLVHFPVCLVISAGLSQWELSPTEALWGMVAAYLVSQIAAVGFYHGVEAPLMRWQLRRSHVTTRRIPGSAYGASDEPACAGRAQEVVSG